MSEPRFRRAAWNALVVVGSGVLFFLVVEGAFSTWVALRAILPQHRIAERHHARHDPLLGWVHIPGVSLPDFYGPGRDLHINAQGFRARVDAYAPAPEIGKRLICSGDSQALGYGVGDLDTWCHLLSARSPVPLETINMGQGGYGVDQSYLWFERDSAPFALDIHLFTFTTGDFDRMLVDEFSGYGKPVLRVEGGSLVVANAPIADPGFIGTLRRSPYKLLAFRSVSSLFRFTAARREQERALAERSRAQLRVLSKVFEELLAANRAKGSALVAVHLPTESEVRQGVRSAALSYLRGRLPELGIPLWELRAELRDVAGGRIDRLYIPVDAPIAARFPGAPGHFNERGSEAVADILLAKLRAAGRL